jgi:hypothetical protein
VQLKSSLAGVLAQWIEHWSSEPGVRSSNLLRPAIFYKSGTQNVCSPLTTRFNPRSVRSVSVTPR